MTAQQTTAATPVTPTQPQATASPPPLPPAVQRPPIPAPTPSPAAVTSVPLPIRAAFYYGWYPSQWSGAGHRYTSTLGEYDSGDAAVIDRHIGEMQFANVQAGIYSWWGAGSATDSRFPVYLEEAARLGFHWALYYELDNLGQATEDSARADLAYFAANYFDSPSYLHVDGKPVLFVYNPGASCASAAKWATLRGEFGVYVSLDDYPEWWTCNPVDSWHGYHSDRALYPVRYLKKMYAVSASAGFWAAWEPAPRLARDLATWVTTVSGVSSSGADWQLMYFNEFGEGTNIEPSTASCDFDQCFDYLQPLHDSP